MKSVRDQIYNGTDYSYRDIWNISDDIIGRWEKIFDDIDGNIIDAVDTRARQEKNSTTK